MKRALALMVLVVLFTGCASWHQTRVEQKDARIEALEQEREEAETDEERARIDAALADEKKDRDKTLDGVREEQKNKQALLMAILSIGMGGLKMAVGTAAKGVL